MCVYVWYVCVCVCVCVCGAELHLTRVRNLNLSGNDIDAQGAIQVITVLKDCHKPMHVNLNKGPHGKNDSDGFHF